MFLQQIMEHIIFKMLHGLIKMVEEEDLGFIKVVPNLVISKHIHYNIQ
jgi:hypothetical protein